VLDPFLGSGTTSVVAQRLHRNSIGVEILKEYYDLARERTGSSALSVGSHLMKDHERVEHC
jgi:DNA modification methylase